MIPLPNPFDIMGSVAGRIVVDGWTATMLALWTAGLWVLRLVLGWVDSLLTPDLSEAGPGADLYRVTFWLAGALVFILGLVQLGIAAAKRDGRELARALIGLVQFGLVWAAWVGYTVLIVAASSGLTRALMESLLNVSSWRASHASSTKSFGARNLWLKGSIARWTGRTSAPRAWENLW